MLTMAAARRPEKAEASEAAEKNTAVDRKRVSWYFPSNEDRPS